jgi:hypothetical protein
VPSEPNAEAFNVIERSSHYFLSQDDEGFALWSVKGDDAGPVLTFPADDDGEARARAAFRRESRFGTWAQVFLVVAFVSATVWIVSVILERTIGLVADAPLISGREADVPTSWLVRSWIAGASAVANAGFTIAVGLSLVIWLHRRYRREG